MANGCRLIDANALRDKVYHWIRDGEFVTLQDVRYAIENAPTVDAVEVSHGRWIELAFGELKCSACDIIQEDNAFPYNYCPNCGAKMDGDGNGQQM